MPILLYIFEAIAVAVVTEIVSEIGKDVIKEKQICDTNS